MTWEQRYRETFNAHEWAEAAAMDALVASLRDQSLDALAGLCDSAAGWKDRSWLSETIIEYASEVLDEKLEAMVA